MNTEEALLAAVIANPEDDLPRLVYCDWLEESGDPKKLARAEFIRVQCELAKHGHAGMDYLRLRKREGQLWGSGRGGLTVSGELDAIALHLVGTQPEVTGLIRRGFVAEVRCTIAEWCGVMCRTCGGDGSHFIEDDGVTSFFTVACRECSATGRTSCIGPEVVRRHPVQVVRTNCMPYLSGSREDKPYSWFRGPTPAGSRMWEPPNDLGVIPPDIYDLMSGYSYAGTRPLAHREFATEQEAHDTLSAALILWAKSQPYPRS